MSVLIGVRMEHIQTAVAVAEPGGFRTRFANDLQGLGDRFRAGHRLSDGRFRIELHDTGDHIVVFQAGQQGHELLISRLLLQLVQFTHGPCGDSHLEAALTIALSA